MPEEQNLQRLIRQRRRERVVLAQDLSNGFGSNLPQLVACLEVESASKMMAKAVLAVSCYLAVGLNVQPATRLTSWAKPRPFARLPLAPLRVSDGPDDEIATAEVTSSSRESAEEAWAKAPEGTFLSPALLFAVFLTGLTIRVVVFGT